MPGSIYTIEDQGQVYEVEANSEAEALAEVRKLTAPGTGGAVYGDTQQPVTAGQERALQGMGGLDPLLPTGSSRNPRFVKPGEAYPQTGTYIDPRGSTVQTDAEPISKTLLAGLSRLTGTDQWQGQQAPWAQSNTLDAMQSGALSGALLGGKNELGAIPEGVGSMFRGEGFGAGFSPALKAADERDRILRENHPYAYYGSGAAGTLATAPLTPTIRTGGVLGRTLGNAAIQGGQGALAGALSTDGSLQDRAVGATVGGILGSSFGAIGGRAGMPDAPQPAPIPLPPELAVVPPRDLARAAGFVRRQGGALPITGANPEMLAGEAIGPRGKVALGALARMEGDTAAALEGRLAVREIDRPQRMLAEVSRATGISPEAAAGDIEAIVQAGQNRVAPLFEASRANPQPVMTDRLRAVTETPAGKKALRLAVDDILNDIDGPGPQALGIEVRGATENGLPDVVTLKAPTLETWDRLYKALGKAVERDSFGRIVPDSASPANFNVNQVRRALRAELGKVSLEWGQAMAGSADYLGAQSAFRTAQDMVFSSRTTARNFSRHMASLSPGEAAAAKAGVANAVFDLAQNGRLRPGSLKTPIVRQKLEAALGKDGADAIAKMVADEDAMMAFKNRYAPSVGPITSDIRNMTDEINQNAVGNAAINAGLATVRGGVGSGVMSLVTDAARGIGDRYVTRGMSVPVKNAAGQMLMGSPSDLAALLASIPNPGTGTRKALKAVSGAALTRSGRTAGILGSQGTQR